MRPRTPANKSKTRREERLELLRALETARKGTTVIAYVTSTRPNLESQMAMDVIPIFGRHLRALKLERKEPRIDCSSIRTAAKAPCHGAW